MITGEATDRSCLRIGRINVTYLVPRDHPNPASVRSQLDAVAGRQVAASCARQFGPLCHDADPSVWFVRRLAVDVTVDAAWETERSSEVWAAQVTRSLGRRLQHGDDGEEVLRFPSRAVWLAQFLRDLADGAAWSKWYYAGLEGLRALPLNAAVREALCREPATGEAALRQVAIDDRLEKVMRALTEADCRTVLLAFCGIAGDAANADVTASRLQVAWEASRRNRELSGEFPAWHHTILQHYLALRNADASPASALLQAIHAAEIAGQRRAPATSSGHADGAQTRRQLFTPFGGVFWLLSRIEDLKLEECARALPDFQDESPAALVRFLVLLKCLGAPRAPRAFYDPVLREVTGVSPDLKVEDVRNWAQAVTPPRTIDFQTRWLANCRQQAVVSRRWLCLRPARRGQLVLLADGERDTWLYVTRSIRELIHCLEAELQPTLSEPSSAPAAGYALLCDPALAGMLPATVLGVPVRASNSSEAAAWAAESPLLATCLKRARSPDEDLVYLSVVSLLRGARQLDLALSLAARSAVCNFAWRLPGFVWSGAEYLYRNFLDAEATIQADEDRWIVKPKRPPLHIVLAMTGADRDVYQISWLNQRKVCLTSAES
jgi:hypothetical protein